MRSNQLPTILLLLVVTLLSTAASSYAEGAGKVVEIARQIQATYAALESLSFNFSQSTSGQMTGRPKIGKGTALLAKPGGKILMRWNYHTPERQVIISDGTSVSMYFEKLNQMIVSSTDRAQTDVLLAFFSGKDPLEDHFLILDAELEMDIEAARELSNLEVIQLRPKNAETQIRTIHLWVDEEALIRRIELLDYFDTRTTLNLSNIVLNPLDLDDQADLDRRFDFAPPEGTEIIKQ
jgi:outer membrane lipoprotein carrier protein